LNFIKRILKTQLFQISLLNSVSILLRVVGGLLASKMIALFVGPAGMALAGNLRNFLGGVDVFSTLGLQNGIIKYTADNEDNKERLQRILATVCISILAAILILSIVLLLPASRWSGLVFNNDIQFAWVFKVLAFALPLYTGNLVFVSLLNGLGKFKQVIYLNIWGNAIGVLFSAVLIWKMGLNGALLGLIIYPALMFFFSLYYVHLRFPYLSFIKLKYFDPTLLKGLFSYSAMSVVTAVLGPIIYINIRTKISQTVSANDAGYWESLNRIASFYLMFASTLLTLYFLPKLSVAKTNIDTRRVFLSYYRGIVPLYAVGFFIIYLLRFFIVKLLFSEAFLPMANFFVWQLVGDFFKICSLILGYEFFAKKMTRAFIATEILSFCVLYLSSNLLIAKYGTEGAVMAHAFTYFVYFSVLIIYFRRKINAKIGD